MNVAVRSELSEDPVAVEVVSDKDPGVALAGLLSAAVGTICGQVAAAVAAGAKVVVIAATGYGDTGPERMVVAGLASATRHYSSELGARDVRVNLVVSRADEPAMPTLGMLTMMTGQSLWV